MSEQAVLVGGWTAYHKLTAEDQAVFDAALKGFVGGAVPTLRSLHPSGGWHQLPLQMQEHGAAAQSHPRRSRGADLPVSGWLSPYHLHHPDLIGLWGKAGRDIVSNRLAQQPAIRKTPKGVSFFPILCETIFPLAQGMEAVLPMLSWWVPGTIDRASSIAST